MAARKFVGVLSWRVAIALNCVSLQKKILNQMGHLVEFQVKFAKREGPVGD